MTFSSTGGLSGPVHDCLKVLQFTAWISSTKDLSFLPTFKSQIRVALLRPLCKFNLIFFTVAKRRTSGKKKFFATTSTSACPACRHAGLHGRSSGDLTTLPRFEDGCRQSLRQSVVFGGAGRPSCNIQAMSRKLDTIDQQSIRIVCIDHFDGQGLKDSCQ